MSLKIGFLLLRIEIFRRIELARVSRASVICVLATVFFAASAAGPGYAGDMNAMSGMEMPAPVSHSTPVPTMPMPMPKRVPMPTKPAAPMMPQAPMMQMDMLDPARMPSVTDAGSPMTREGSGTSWMPDAGPMYGNMRMRGGDMEMTHYALFLRYLDTGSARGDRRVVAPGWWMYMRTHPLSPNSQLGVRLMVTPDAATVGGSGYPELFQTGESWHGRPLHDTQHPHDLVSELAATFSSRIGPQSSVFFYAGYPGEPALGPPAYMHRALAYDYASAPIGHHWEDATHITFGVLTAGVTAHKFKFEGSAFTGSEPDSVRTNFDQAHLDSSSARVSWNPNRYIAAQVSGGFIKHPEALTPGVDVRRSTASVLYDRPLDARRSWSQAVVFGQNHDSNGERTNAYLYETDYRVAADAYFARFEYVQKSGSDLVLAPADADVIYPVTALTAGTVHDLPHRPGGAVAGAGFDLTYNLKPASLAPYYGGGNPFGFEIFFRIRPSELGLNARE